MLSLNHWTLKTKIHKTVRQTLAPTRALVRPHWLLQFPLHPPHRKGIREHRKRVESQALVCAPPPPPLEGAAGRPTPPLTAHSSNMRNTEGVVPTAKPLRRLCASGLRGAGEGLPLRPEAARGAYQSHQRLTLSPAFSAYSVRDTSTLQLEEAEHRLPPRPPSSRGQQPRPQGRKSSGARARAHAFSRF